MNEFFGDEVSNRMIQNVGILGLVTALAGPELEKRADQYEDGSRVFDKEDVLRDLRAAINGMKMLNIALLDKVENG